jgi:hypothetical protein
MGFFTVIFAMRRAMLTHSRSQRCRRGVTTRLFGGPNEVDGKV